MCSFFTTTIVYILQNFQPRTFLKPLIAKNQESCCPTINVTRYCRQLFAKFTGLNVFGPNFEARSLLIHWGKQWPMKYFKVERMVLTKDKSGFQYLERCKLICQTNSWNPSYQIILKSHIRPHSEGKDNNITVTNIKLYSAVICSVYDRSNYCKPITMIINQLWANTLITASHP